MLKIIIPGKFLEFCTLWPYRRGHDYDFSALVSLLSFRVRSRASLELELVALRHQVTVLRRQRPSRARLFCADRLLWVWLYRIWPQILNAMVLVKPATVIQWHRKGFRLYWRWRSRHLGRPKMNSEIRDLIRQMSVANPLWGAPRIHGELLKLGIEVSQATVGRYLPWRPKIPSPTWRSFLHNHLAEIAAIDMFVVATAVKFEDIPRVALRDRIELTKLTDGFWHVTVHFGFVQVPDIPAALRLARERGCPINLEDAIYFGARDTIVCPKKRNWLVRISLRLFAFMFRNSVRAVDLFKIPPEKFVEIGRQIEI